MKTLIHSTLLACVLFCPPVTQAKKQPATITLEANRPSGDCQVADYEFDTVNTQYEVVLPIDIDAAKQLIIDSSAPLGFRFPKKIKDHRRFPECQMFNSECSCAYSISFLRVFLISYS